MPQYYVLHLKKDLFYFVKKRVTNYNPVADLGRKRITIKETYG